MTTTPPARVETYTVTRTPDSITLTLNGHAYDVAALAFDIAADLEEAYQGHSAMALRVLTEALVASGKPLAEAGLIAARMPFIEQPAAPPAKDGGA